MDNRCTLTLEQGAFIGHLREVSGTIADWAWEQLADGRSMIGVRACLRECLEIASQHTTPTEV